MTTLQSSLLNTGENLRHGISTRPGGVSPRPLDLNLSLNVGDDPSNVQRNRELFFGRLEIPLDQLAVPKQIHGGTVVCAESAGEYRACDAMVTNVRGVYLCVSVADCLPILLHDPHKQVVAVVHAGWRGTVAQVTRNAVKEMRERFGSFPQNIVAYIGSSAGACCYAVGEDVAGKFDAKFIREGDGLIYVDLKGANVRQLIEAGVSALQIDVSAYCTICNPKLFHSYRRDKEQSGRMMGVIGLG